jgi:hypothetical protein
VELQDSDDGEVIDGHGHARAAEPEPEIRIKQHKLSDRTPEEAFAVQPNLGDAFRPVDHGELVETITLGPETGEVARYVALHKRTAVFRWGWSTYDYEENDFETLKQAREDLIERLRLDIAATEEDRRNTENRLMRERQKAASAQ